MICPKCKKPMTLILHWTATGPAGNETRKEWRCYGCWHHEVETGKRETR